jgi:hypothetical protein
MGNFYVNYTLRGVSQKAVAQALAGRTAYVSPEDHSCVVVYDEESDSQDQDVITELAQRLSDELNCTVLAVLNHDDDVFWYNLCTKGKVVDEYDSSPDHFDGGDEESAPSGGNAKKLCAAFGTTEVEEVDKILHDSSEEDSEYAFAVERHGALAHALGLPEFSVGAGFQTISEGELPESLDEDDLIRTS